MLFQSAAIALAVVAPFADAAAVTRRAVITVSHQRTHQVEQPS